MRDDEIKFAVDGMLGRLGRYLRALGYDTSCAVSPGDAVFRAAREEGRIVITLRGSIPDGVTAQVLRIERASIDRQLATVFDRLRIRADRKRVLTVCLECNLPTVEADAEDVAGDVPAKVRERVASYRRCPRCKRVYWWGSHAERIMELLEKSGVFG